MLIYSQTIVTFIKRIRQYAKEILLNEMQLVLHQNRFQYFTKTYPLVIVVFENQKVLGRCEPRFYQIGLNKKLVYSAKIPVIKNILRHELAHLITAIDFGENVDAHGPEFKSVCKRYQWGEDVSAATVDILEANDEIEGDLSTEKVLGKIKKLFSLASSSNQHEAELATIKANELLVRHNLDSLYQNQQPGQQLPQEDEEVYVQKVLESSRNSQKLHCIYEILRTFFVQPVFNYGNKILYLEVTGSKANVLIAEYVAQFLDKELERLWHMAKVESQGLLTGRRSKNSFMKGVAKGYSQKIKDHRKTEFSAYSKDIILLEKKLKDQVALAYNRLRNTSVYQGSTDGVSLSMGESAGRNLNINPSLSSRKESNVYLPYK